MNKVELLHTELAWLRFDIEHIYNIYQEVPSWDEIYLLLCWKDYIIRS